MKKVVVALLALLAIIGGIFGVTKVREVVEEQSHAGEVICLYGCPAPRRRKFIKIK